MEDDGDEDSEASMEESGGEEETQAAQMDKAKAFAAILKKSGTFFTACQ